MQQQQRKTMDVKISDEIIGQIHVREFINSSSSTLSSSSSSEAIAKTTTDGTYEQTTNQQSLSQSQSQQLQQKPLEIIQPYCYPIIQSSIRSSKNGKIYAKIHCPFCNEDVGSVLDNLWLHFYESHQDKYEFTVVRENEYMTHFGAKEKPFHDLRFTTSNNNNYNNNEIKSSSSTMKPSLEATLKQQQQQQQNQNSNTKFIPQRQYYHFATLDRIQPHEYIMDIDCEQDHYMDTTWYHELNEANLSDFTDVHDMECRFLLIWNRFLRENPVLRRKELPSRMLEFALHYAEKESLLSFTEHVQQQQQQQQAASTSSTAAISSTDATTTASTTSPTSLTTSPFYTSIIEPFTLFLLSRWDEGELNRTQLEYILDLFHTLVDTKHV